jgi:hypothetical protein
MRIWIALLVAPMLALTDLTIAFATVSWACAHQAAFSVHLVHAAFFALTLASTLAAWTAWREGTGATANGDTPPQAHFLAGVATASAALSTLTVAAMWMPVSVIAPCIS